MRVNLKLELLGCLYNHLDLKSLQTPESRRVMVPCGDKSEVAIVCKTIEIHERVRIMRNLLRRSTRHFFNASHAHSLCDGKVLLINVLKHLDFPVQSELVKISGGV
jgi:hypothetical protein